MELRCPDARAAAPERADAVPCIGASQLWGPPVVHEASQDERDVFESGCAARWARWLAAHDGDHPDRAEVEARAARQRAACFGGCRDVLGLAHLGLLAV